MTSQKENTQNIDLLASSFQMRYEPNFAIGNAVSNYLMLPELRGFWPFSSFNETAQALDLSGQGRTLSNTGPVTRAVAGLLPYCVFNGASYLSRADEAGLDITGALTLGGWFATGAAVLQVFMSKFGAAGQRAYSLFCNATSDIGFYISVDGTALAAGATSTAPFTYGPWHFIVGRYTPSTEIAVWCDGTKGANVAAIPAACFNSNAALRVSGDAGGGTNLTGYSALCFLCAAALSDTVITNLYQQSRAIFGL